MQPKCCEKSVVSGGAKSLINSAALMDVAKNAAEAAYAHYSKLFVGAALLCTNGKIYRGCNVENIAFPLGTCAEQAAIAAARLAEAETMKIRAIAIYARRSKSSHVACSPCGGCRQRIAEFGLDIPVLFYRTGTVLIELPIKELLPYSFKFKAR
jgi:cytidine deaminase